MLATVSALVLLLLAPGPTNTLLLRAGVLFGFRASWKLVFIECLAYLLQVTLWGVALLYLSVYAPWAVKLTQLAAGAYLLLVSYQLWLREKAQAAVNQDRFTGLSFFWLTVMNPKGLLIASLIAPINTFIHWAGYLVFMSTLALVVLPVGAAWVAFGAGIVGRQPGWLSALAINRVAAIAIGCFATVLLGRLADSIFN
ncbi:LysE family translocator [Pseudomonas veronii]|jgi:threonine/homoserine/homoserine lactone efflux protein|uniref:Threonine transporter RhtB n=1 Tax=Pseudomonas veronii TaxID=76761 RepID=A0A7Y1A209_PSEVE|nr:threonine transporter RhtB [Pseudomonas veronii]NMY07638.1 threonine transporter RhtB [Pseudomonas veronii]